MKEIKFKGKTINNEWVFGYLTVLSKKYNNVEPGMYISNDAGKPFAYQVIPESVGQFIVLQDENGKEIYEKDIVSFTKTHNNEKYIGIVEYCEEVAGFMLRTINNEPWYSFEFGLGTTDLKVISNRYENSELFEND